MDKKACAATIVPLPLGAPGTDAEAVEAMFVEYRSEVRNHIAGKFPGSTPDPDDVMQTVFERLIKHPNISTIENPRAFLYAAARNVAIDECRRLASLQKFERDAVETRRFTAIDELTPERVVLSRADLENVMAAIRRLPEDLREILRLHRVDGLSYTAIARHLGVSEAAIRRRMAKILVRMHEALESGS